jgi:hypothetical protein
MSAVLNGGQAPSLNHIRGMGAGWIAYCAQKELISQGYSRLFLYLSKKILPAKKT